MITHPARPLVSNLRDRAVRIPGGNLRTLLLLMLAILLASPALFSQGAPKVSGVDPATGKVNDSVTVSGANLAKDSVSAVFLSDEKSDYKAVIVEQSADKIVMKVPQVKPGSYNISIQVGNGILIEPVRMTVQ
ncbi:MAG TPA: IPT/TIG domain-containing protein [Candidatus Acidoferrales bacterium]|nr:IPT/TIG domain-containing protein [Candidatus Acidoferrales bacterium]